MMYIPDDATHEEVAELAAEAKALRLLGDVQRLLQPVSCPCHGWLCCPCSGVPDYEDARIRDERISALVDRSLSGFLTAAESAELDAEARRRGWR